MSRDGSYCSQLGGRLMRRVRTWLVIFVLLGCVVLLAAAWRSGLLAQPVNSPYPSGAPAANTLFSAFTGRSPKYLDAASSYYSDETPYTYIIFQPLYGFDYLHRPYVLIPRAAAQVVTPWFLDADGNRLPEDAPGDLVAESVYDIPIKKGVM